VRLDVNKHVTALSTNKKNMSIVPSLAPLIRDHHEPLCNKRTTSQIEICSWCGGRNDKFQRRLESSSAKRDAGEKHTGRRFKMA
jgi:hypothetical protein